MRRLFLSVVLVALVAGCNTTGSVNLTGTWDGTLSDAYFGNGTFTTTVTQSGSNINGDYTVTYPGLGMSTGLISGTVSGSTVNFTIGVAGCTANGSGTASSSHFAGSYTYASGCAAAGFTGTFSGNKR